MPLQPAALSVESIIVNCVGTRKNGAACPRGRRPKVKRDIING